MGDLSHSHYGLGWVQYFLPTGQLLAAISPAAFVVAFTSGALVGVVAMLGDLAFLAGLVDVSCGGVTPSKTSLLE